MRTNTLALVGSLALAACQPGNSGGDAGDPPAPPTPHGDDDGDSDDPDDGGRDDEGDAQPVCDISQFPQIIPEWIVEVESPIEGALPSVDEIEIVADTMFIAGRHTVSSSEPPGFLERRSLDGELLWAIDSSRSPGALSWDGSHIYASLGNEVRRWTGDGAEDDWVFAGQFIKDVDATGEAVAIVGSYIEPGGHPDFFDAFYGSLTKTVPPQFRGATLETLEVNDRGHKVVRSPWGGWIASGSVNSEPPTLWLHGFEGPPFDVTLNVGDHPRVHSMLSLEDQVLVMGRSSTDPEMWIVALGSEGNELWRQGLWVCGEVVGSLQHLVSHEGQLWSLGTVRAGPELYRPLLVQLGWDGAVERVFAVHSPETYARMHALDSDGFTLYLGGSRHGSGVQYRAIGKVRP